ncbi:hypothetical protein EVAR_52892_1 [Eumeta japonica]|uniref:Uncharacterized protein n=1 Tax=Eumeta variegata TaxID=151549 RepID=A0A4C1Z266_EUMVA|nr:hypothetical protein EVAR_52892_1 [Eumeta japonica]
MLRRYSATRPKADLGGKGARAEPTTSRSPWQRPGTKSPRAHAKSGGLLPNRVRIRIYLLEYLHRCRVRVASLQRRYGSARGFACRTYPPVGPAGRATGAECLKLPYRRTLRKVLMCKGSLKRASRSRKGKAQYVFQLLDGEWVEARAPPPALQDNLTLDTAQLALAQKQVQTE